MKALLSIGSVFVALHGLVHIMGFVAYWPLGVVAELPYRTTLLGVDVGAAGMQVFAVLWLLAAIAFVVAVVGSVVRAPWWQRWMLSTIVLSTALIALDWAVAFRGAIVNLGILVVMLLAAQRRRLGEAG